jgi:hypothetical protein
MGRADTFRLAYSYLALQETRRTVREGHARLIAGSTAVLFAFVSMLVGGMLVFANFSNGYTLLVLWGSGTGQGSWNYPGLLLVAPWGVVSLPFLATLTMLLVSAAVGLSVAAAVRLVVPLLRRRWRGPLARSAGTGAAVGTTPAIVGLATLGACCCTSCSTVGLSVVAAASGSSVNSLLVNNWYLDVFQLAVVGIALLAQERTLHSLRGTCVTTLTSSRQLTGGVLLRLGLLVAGITWSIAMFAEWSDTNPLTASAAVWYHWIFEHQVLSVTAVAAGMFPREFSSAVRSVFRRLPGLPWRMALFAGGITWGTWVPPLLASAGLGGFVNELLGHLNVPAAWGAIPPDSALGAPLYFHWAFQHLLLAAYGIAVAAVPERATEPLLWSTGMHSPAHETSLLVAGGPAPGAQ